MMLRRRADMTATCRARIIVPPQGLVVTASPLWPTVGSVP